MHEIRHSSSTQPARAAPSHRRSAHSRTLGAGAADRSYGIHVAELAGLPATVITRARAVLALLEENRAAADLVPALDELPLFTPQSIAAPEADKLREALAALDPDRLSPREALDWLYRLRALMSPDKDGNVL